MNYLNSIIKVSEFQNQNHFFETSEICTMSYTCSLCCLCLPSFWVVWFVTLYPISWHFISLWAYKNKPRALWLFHLLSLATHWTYSRGINSSLRRAPDVRSETAERAVEVALGKVLSQCPESGVTVRHALNSLHSCTKWSNVSLGRDGLKELFYEDENFLIFFYSFILVRG